MASIHKEVVINAKPDAVWDALRVVWIADLLPDEAAERTSAMMQRGIETVRSTLEAPRPLVVPRTPARG